MVYSWFLKTAMSLGHRPLFILIDVLSCIRIKGTSYTIWTRPIYRKFHWKYWKGIFFSGNTSEKWAKLRIAQIPFIISDIIFNNVVKNAKDWKQWNFIVCIVQNIWPGAEQSPVILIFARETDFIFLAFPTVVCGL